ncbi:MAG: hypothetical protein MZV65_34615 [Chromatiales bacterium]|nr:hypothetical protein [Chromatiales bacterium]
MNVRCAMHGRAGPARLPARCGCRRLHAREATAQAVAEAVRSPAGALDRGRAAAPRPDDAAAGRRCSSAGRARCGLPLVAAGDVHMHVRARKRAAGRAHRHRASSMPVAAVRASRCSPTPSATCARARAWPRSTRPSCWPHTLRDRRALRASRSTSCATSTRRRSCPPGDTPAQLAAPADRGGRCARATRRACRAAVRAPIEHELALIAELQLRAVLPHRARHRALRARARHPVPGPRLGGQLGGLLLPGHHRGGPGAHERCCSSASSRSERNEPPDIDVDFEHQRREEVIQYIYAQVRPRPRRADRRGHQLPAAQRAARRRAGRWASTSTQVDALAKSHALVRTAARSLPSACARPASIPTTAVLRQWLELAARADRLSAPPLASTSGGFVIARGPLDAAGAGRERRHGRAHRDPVGQGRPRRARAAQGRRAGARHAQRHPPRASTLVERAPAARTLAHAATIPAEDPAVYDMICARRHRGRVPDRKPRARWRCCRA